MCSILKFNEIEEICGIGYEKSSLAYKKLQTFFMKKMDMPYEKAVTWCLQVWANSCEGNMPTNVIRKMTDVGIAFKNDKEINEFVELLMDAHDNTRMKVNRGHKPKELSSKRFVGNTPVDFEEDMDTVSTMFFPEGLSGSVVRAERKIYPNDPCPCGSGKKYKKCCGGK